MYAINLREFKRWSAIPNPAVRFWIRSWIDSLNVSTPVHWQQSPLGLIGLSHLWFYTIRQRNKYTARQRNSLKAMSLRRHDEPLAVGTMPSFDDDDAAWCRYFGLQIDNFDNAKSSIIDWHLNELPSCEDPSTICSHQNVLYSLLILSGMTSDQLFSAVCKGVLDPEQRRETSPSENLQNWLQQMAVATDVELMAYTKLVYIGPEGPNMPSNALKRKWSHIHVDSITDFHGYGTQFVVVGDELQPYVVTRCPARGGMGELHRREARRAYALKLQKKPELPVFTMSSRSDCMDPAPVPTVRPFYCDASFGRARFSFYGKGDTDGAILYAKAAQDLFDDPEEAIRNLMVGAELRWRRRTTAETDAVLANAYRFALRTRLAGDASDYLQRVRKLGGDPSVPANSSYRKIAEWNRHGDPVFANLLATLEAIESIDDELIIYRLRELAHWYPIRSARPNELFGDRHTWREVANVIALSRGIRNSSTHFKPADTGLYGVLLYIARVLFEAFRAAWIRDSLTSSSA